MIVLLSLLLLLGGFLWGVANSITTEKLQSEVKKSRILVGARAVVYLLIVLAIMLGGVR